MRGWHEARIRVARRAGKGYPAFMTKSSPSRDVRLDDEAIAPHERTIPSIGRVVGFARRDLLVRGALLHEPADGRAHNGNMRCAFAPKLVHHSTDGVPMAPQLFEVLTFDVVVTTAELADAVGAVR